MKKLILNENYIFHTIDGEAVVVPTAGASFHGLVQGNKSVGAILECLSRGATQEDIVKDLCDRFDGNEAEIREDVADVIARLREIGAIDEA